MSDDHAKKEARAQLESIQEDLETLDRIVEDGPMDTNWGTLDQDEMREEITNDALSVEVREAWHRPGESEGVGEFTILLCTGGPAVRLVGELWDRRPETVSIQYQDWFTPWEAISITVEETEALLRFADFFYFGG